MKILSQNLKSINSYIISTPQQQKVIVQKPILQSDVFAKPTSFNYQAYALNNIYFGKTVKLKQVIDYKNREKYLDYMDSRIKNTVHNRTKDEIDVLIDEIAKSNNVDKKDVAEVMGRVVQFTSYSQLPKIFTGMQKCGVNRLGTLYSNNYADLNNVLYYVGYKKKQIIKDSFPNSPKRVESLILDEKTLEHLKNLRDGLDVRDYNCIKSSVKDGSLKLFIVDGWHTKINGKDMSYGAFGAQHDLKTVVDTIVKEQKNTGKSLDEILNGYIINRAKEVFGDDVEVNIIKNQNMGKPTALKISDIMHHNAPNKEYIRAVLDAFAIRALDKQHFSTKERNMWREILSEYYDKALCIYSPETLNEEMKTLYSKIEKKVEKFGKTMNDVVYLIPALDKSFELINYQYAKVNNIPSKKFFYHDGLGKGIKSTDYGSINLNDKVAVVLDDFAGSGESLIDMEFCFSDFMKNNKDTYLIISTVSALSEGANKIRNKMKKYPNSSFITNKEFSFEWDFKKKLSDNKVEFLDKLAMEDAIYLLSEVGYKSGAACVAFPYMLPDNNLYHSNVLLNYTNNKKINNKSNNSENLLHIISHIMKNRRNNLPYDTGL